MDLALIGLGSDLATKGNLPGVVSSYIRGILLAGNFRTQHELNMMTHDDQRNTLIVEMTKHSNQTNFQHLISFCVGIMHASTAAAHMANDVEHDFAPTAPLPTPSIN